MNKEKEKNKKSVLVTGGSGFIASHLVDSLIKIGYFVVNIDKLDYCSYDNTKNINNCYKFIHGNISNKELITFILNEYYKSDLDNFRKGTVEFPFNSLSNGEHSVTFKIWDVFNNSSEKTINFLDTDDSIATISNFLNYPNPFSNGTDFYFQNNQAGQVMDINIQIYTVTGRLVKTINESFYNDGFRVGPISWDGKSSNGENLSAGLYIANLNINLENGKFETKSIRIAITP